MGFLVILLSLPHKPTIIYCYINVTIFIFLCVLNMYGIVVACLFEGVLCFCLFCFVLCCFVIVLQRGGLKFNTAQC